MPRSQHDVHALAHVARGTYRFEHGHAATCDVRQVCGPELETIKDVGRIDDGGATRLTLLGQEAHQVGPSQDIQVHCDLVQQEDLGCVEPGQNWALYCLPIGSNHGPRPKAFVLDAAPCQCNTLNSLRSPTQIWTRLRWPSETWCMRHCGSMSNTCTGGAAVHFSCP